MRDLIYDIETFINLFSITFKDVKTGKKKVFEMSPWRNDWAEFLLFAKNCSNGFVRWVGFNNYYFDYGDIHYMIQNYSKGDFTGEELALAAHKRGVKLITAGKNERFNYMIWDNNQIVPQVDLFKIHHFDNMARATSLKVLEFNMKSKTIQDLPYPPDEYLTYEQAREVITYNIHDVDETFKFYLESLDMIHFREKLTKKYNRNFINHNDTKIGKDYFIMALEEAGINCYWYEDGQRKPVQTKRPVIRLNDVIFPYIKFKRPEFNAVLDWLRKQKIKETKGTFTQIPFDGLGGLERYINPKKVKGNVKNLNCIVDGFQFDFGTGGIHGSIPSTIVSQDDKYAIIDYDVTSLYPSIAIVNEVFPKHLTKKFCEIYAKVKKDRLSYPKGTPENAMLKLALNGVYGDSNNVYSPFYDPQYTMTITINGQLMLCMLAEMLMEIDDLTLIQINTDGVTIKVPRDKISLVEQKNKEWMNITKLDLERADYKRMFIRDVNNYIGEYTDGKLKRKGAYEYDIEWHQNHSALIVKKAVEDHLINGTNLRDFIVNHSMFEDIHDFMLRTKIPRTSRLVWGDKPMQRVTRYFISDDGQEFTKIMPPLKGKTDERHIAVNKGFKVTPMNKMGEVKNINFDWYVGEAEKLINPLLSGVLNDMLT